MNYQLFALGHLLPTLVAPTIGLICYFVASHGSLLRRLLLSSQGFFLFLAAYYALVISLWSKGQWQTFILPFWILLALSLIAMVYSFFHYRGRLAIVHALQVFILPSAFLLWFIGAMTIAHDWI